jgi:hypothetical protein
LEMYGERTLKGGALSPVRRESAVKIDEWRVTSDKSQREKSQWGVSPVQCSLRGRLYCNLRVLS